MYGMSAALSAILKASIRQSMSTASSKKRRASDAIDAAARARPRRNAALAAVTKIAAIAAIEAAPNTAAAIAGVASVAPASTASILRFATGESQSVLASDLKRVPIELIDVQKPGVLRTPELYTQGVPTHNAKTRVLQFADAPDFQPNLTPSEILQAGAFGGMMSTRIRMTQAPAPVIDILSPHFSQATTFARLHRPSRGACTLMRGANSLLFGSRVWCLRAT